MQTEKAPLKTTWIGIDVAKNSFVASIYIPVNPDENHRKISNIPVAEFERTCNDVKALYEWTYYHQIKNNVEAGNMRAVMEATGRYSLKLYDWLMDKMPLSEPALSANLAEKLLTSCSNNGNVFFNGFMNTPLVFDEIKVPLIRFLFKFLVFYGVNELCNKMITHNKTSN